MPPTNISAWPYSVTLDWAMAAPEKRVAAIAASLIAGLYCFFMFKTSVVVMLLRTFLVCRILMDLLLRCSPAVRGSLTMQWGPSRPGYMLDSDVSR